MQDKQIQIAGTDCDTVVTLNLTIDNTCNQITFAPMAEICADYEQIFINYSVANGTLVSYSATFDSQAIAAGFTNIPVSTASSNTIEIPLQENVRPNIIIP